MKKPNTQNMVRHGVHNNSKEQQMQMAKQLSLEEFHYRQKMEKRGSTFEYGGGSDSRSAPDACCNVAGSCVGGGVVLPQPSSKTRLKLHGMDADDVYRGASAQTEIGTSELRKAWAEWFHNNGIPGIKADCPYFRRAMELTQQLGFNVAVPTGAEIDGAYLDADEEEINVDAINAEKSCEAVLDMPLITWTEKHIGKNHKANKKYHEMANTLTQDLGSPGSKRKRVEVKQGKQPMNNKEEFMGSDDEMGIPSDMSNMPRQTTVQRQTADSHELMISGFVSFMYGQLNIGLMNCTENLRLRLIPACFMNIDLRWQIGAVAFACFLKFKELLYCALQVLINTIPNVYLRHLMVSVNFVLEDDGECVVSPVVLVFLLLVPSL